MDATYLTDISKGSFALLLGPIHEDHYEITHPVVSWLMHFLEATVDCSTTPFITWLKRLIQVHNQLLSNSNAWLLNKPPIRTVGSSNKSSGFVEDQHALNNTTIAMIRAHLGRQRSAGTKSQCKYDAPRLVQATHEDIYFRMINQRILKPWAKPGLPARWAISSL